MFPEGTDKTEHTTRRSAEYARKAGLHAFRHLLHPRMAGFIHLVKQMKKRKPHLSDAGEQISFTVFSNTS